MDEVDQRGAIFDCHLRVCGGCHMPGSLPLEREPELCPRGGELYAAWAEAEVERRTRERWEREAPLACYSCGVALWSSTERDDGRCGPCSRDAAESSVDVDDADDPPLPW